MKKQFTKQSILDNRGCYSPEQVEKLSFINKDNISIHDIINSEIKLNDKFWFVRNKTNLTLDNKKQLTLILAEVVLEIYNKKYPDDKRVANCIQGIKDFNANIISREEFNVLRNKCWDAKREATAAADVATAAAYAAAAYATATAAAAAYATATATAAAADAAADADAYAAAYATAAAYAAAYATATAAAYATDADAATAAYAAAYAAADADAAAKINLATKLLNKVKDIKKDKTYTEKLIDSLVNFVNTTKED